MDNPFYPDIEGHESNEVVLENLDGSNDAEIKARNLQKIKGAFYKYRWVVSDALEGNHSSLTGFDPLPNESIATAVLKDNGDSCTIYDAVWDPDAGDYGDCVDVTGECYEDSRQIKLPYSDYPYVVVYEAIDYCHNKYYELCYIYVKDKTKPTPVVDKGLTVSLTDKKAWVDAEHFDEGSWDNCDINLMLARRTDWWTACVDLEYDTCWVGHHDDIIYKFELDNEKDPFDYTKQVEAHYSKVLEWLKYDGIPCGITIWNAWMYDLLKKATQYHDPTITDEYFRKVFDFALVNQGECVDYTINYPQEDCGDDGHWEPLWQKFKQEPLHPGLGCIRILLP